MTGVVLASVMFVACVAPWLIRNYRIFGQFVFIRSNFGAELRLGNGPGANGTWMDYLHPTKNVAQLHLYRQLGEIAYVSERKRQALAFIRDDYARFAGLCIRRFIYYWDWAAALRFGWRRWQMYCFSSPRCWPSGDSDGHCGSRGQGHGFFCG